MVGWAAMIEEKLLSTFDLNTKKFWPEHQNCLLLPLQNDEESLMTMATLASFV